MDNHIFIRSVFSYGQDTVTGPVPSSLAAHNLPPSRTRFHADIIFCATVAAEPRRMSCAVLGRFIGRTSSASQHSTSVSLAIADSKSFFFLRWRQPATRRQLAFHRKPIRPAAASHMADIHWQCVCVCVSSSELRLNQCCPDRGIDFIPRMLGILDVARRGKNTCVKCKQFYECERLWLLHPLHMGAITAVAS